MDLERDVEPKRQVGTVGIFEGQDFRLLVEESRFKETDCSVCGWMCVCLCILYILWRKRPILSEVISSGLHNSRGLFEGKDVILRLRLELG